MEKITAELVNYYENNKRDLPWRHTKDPYLIWVSEIMLQQTRVETVIDYYYRFTKKLPNLKSLAEIKEDELLKLWEGLGYYSRVKNMQKTAQILTQNGKSTLPDTKEELIKLPGIGSYTAGAILSIAYNKKEVAIDGNVYRVLSRVYKIKEPINKPSTYKQFEKRMTNLLPNKNVGSFTQSFMDLGSTICTPKNPHCENCPLKQLCLAFKSNTQENFPVKEKKKAPTLENYSVFIFVFKGKVAIQKREEEGLLASLYEFPNHPKTLTLKELKKVLNEKQIAFISIEELGEKKHIFSHKIWKMTGYKIELAAPLNNFLWVTKKELGEKYSLPSAFAKWK